MWQPPCPRSLLRVLWGSEKCSACLEPVPQATAQPSAAQPCPGSRNSHRGPGLGLALPPSDAASSLFFQSQPGVSVRECFCGTGREPWLSPAEHVLCHQLPRPERLPDQHSWHRHSVCSTPVSGRLVVLLAPVSGSQCPLPTDAERGAASCTGRQPFALPGAFPGTGAAGFPTPSPNTGAADV